MQSETARPREATASKNDDDLKDKYDFEIYDNPKICMSLIQSYICGRMHTDVSIINSAKSSNFEFLLETLPYP